MSDENGEVPQATIGWPRAVGSGVAILVAALVLTVGATDWLLSDLTSPSRDARVALATGLFVIVVGAVAWMLRRLQARGLV
jgi:hypothetical protein